MRLDHGKYRAKDYVKICLMRSNGNEFHKPTIISTDYVSVEATFDIPHMCDPYYYTVSGAVERISLESI